MYECIAALGDSQNRVEVLELLFFSFCFILCCFASVVYSANIVLCCMCARSQRICVCVITRFDIYTHRHQISAIRYSGTALAPAFARTMCLNCRIGRSIRVLFM